MTWGRDARTFVVVVEPAPASLLTDRGLARLAAMANAPRVVAVENKVREPGDAGRVALSTGLPVVGSVPWDDAMRSAARPGRSVLDHDADAPAVAALRSLVDALREKESP